MTKDKAPVEIDDAALNAVTGAGTPSKPKPKPAPTPAPPSGGGGGSGGFRGGVFVAVGDVDG